MPPTTQEHTLRLVSSIKTLHVDVDAEASRLRTPAILSSFDKHNCESWCLSVVGDALVKIRLLIEQNFQFIETMGLIAVARYMFELSVWLLLFERDARYGLVYYGQLLETQRKYYQDLRSQLIREISLMTRFEREDENRTRSVIEENKNVGQIKSIGDRIRRAQALIDAQAARHFSIYAEQAKTNGYGFQAFLIETKALPGVDEALRMIGAEQRSFAETITEDIRAMIPKRWEWKRAAEVVGLVDEYDYLYTFSSKLLHATPVSITTDQKNLELDEMLVFLKYINVKIADILAVSAKFPRCPA